MSERKANIPVTSQIGNNRFTDFCYSMTSKLTSVTPRKKKLCIKALKRLERMGKELA